MLISEKFVVFGFISNLGLIFRSIVSLLFFSIFLLFSFTNSSYGKISTTHGDDKFQTNTGANGWQAYRVAVRLSNGNFVRVWPSNDQDGSNASICYQIFDLFGVKVGDEFLVNVDTFSSDRIKLIVADFSNGNFVIIWYGDQNKIFGRIFDPSGIAVSDEFQANIIASDSQGVPSILAFKHENFVVAQNRKVQGTSEWNGYSTILELNTISTANNFVKEGIKNRILELDKTDFVKAFSSDVTKIQILTLPSHGSLILHTKGPVKMSQEIIADNLDYLYFDPNEGWVGNTKFSWRASDGLNYSNNATITIDINDLPDTKWVWPTVIGASVAVGTTCLAFVLGGITAVALYHHKRWCDLLYDRYDLLIN